jgi:hypothetical protein
VISGGSGLRPHGLSRRDHRVCKMLVPQCVSARVGHEVRDGCCGVAGSCRWNTQVFDLRVEQPREHVILRRVVAVQRAQRDAGPAAISWAPIRSISLALPSRAAAARMAPRRAAWSLVAGTAGGRRSPIRGITPVCAVAAPPVPMYR